MSFWTTARERPDSTLTGAATSSRFHGIPLQKSGLDGFLLLRNHFSGQRQLQRLCYRLWYQRIRWFVQYFLWSEHRRLPGFRCPERRRRAIVCTASRHAIFKMRSAATDNGTQRNHRVILTGFRQCVSRRRQFVRARNPNNGGLFSNAGQYGFRASPYLPAGCR